MTPERPVVVLCPKPDDETVSAARFLATEIGCPIQPRRGRTIAGVFREGHDAVIGVSKTHASFFISSHEPPFLFHPGLAKNRIGSLLRGEPETLTRAAGLVEGSTFFDATLGRATDALVVAHAVGDSGRVVGVEANPIVAAVVRLGLRRSVVPGKAVTAAMRRVEARQGDHRDALAAEASDSWDVVYFDPFFEKQVRGSVDMTPLRLVGCHDGVSVGALEEAQRVARRCVVHKVRVDHDPPPAVQDWNLVRGKRRTGYLVWHKG